MRVIAKAYADRPLDRVVVEAAGKTAYIAAEAAVRQAESTDLVGVGFPKDCIFAFDEGLYDSLCAAWNARDEPKLCNLWAEAKPVTDTAYNDL